MDRQDKYRYNYNISFFLLLLCASSALCKIPLIYDWRNNIELPPARNQGGCGSCWAVASIDTMEAKIIIQSGSLPISLSPQWLVSCTQGGDGCSGGVISAALNSLSCDSSAPDSCGNSGAVPESEFPYQASEVPCGCETNNYSHPYCIESYARIGASAVPTALELKQAILDHGPVVTAMKVYTDFYGYNSGIYEQVSGTYQGNKAITIVGWGTDLITKTDYWIIRNTWGPGWGEGGYFRAKIGTSDIGSYAYYIENVRGAEPDPYCGQPGQKYMQADFNKDCYVDLEDLAQFALDWLKCNDPANSDCEY